MSAKPCETDDDVRCVVLVHLEEVTVIDNGFDDVANIVWLIR